MKKLILLSFLLVATLLVHAQRGGGNIEAKIQKQVDRMTEQLNLSPEQQTQIYQLYIDRQENRKAGGKRGRDLSQAEREVLKTERAAAKTAFDNNIAAVLTPAQYETFQNLPKGQGQKAGKGKGGQGQRGIGEKGKVKKDQAQNIKNVNKGKAQNKRGNIQKFTPEQRAQRQADRLNTQLNLDDNQRAAVYDLYLNKGTVAKRADWKSLSKEERTALREKRKNDKADFEASMVNILSPAQYETYQGLAKKGKKSKGKQGLKGKKGKKAVKIIEE